MSMETLIRGFFAFVFAATLGGAIYYKSSRETEAELEDNQKRYIAYLPTYVLPIFLLILAIALPFYYGIEASVQMMASFCFGIFLHICVYYLFLLIVLPFLRKYFNARTCATLWLLPNYLYLTTQSFMEVERPFWIIQIPGKWINIIAAIWLAGVVLVLGWKILSHLVFRRSILSRAKPVTDPLILDVWAKEQKAAGFKKADYKLMVSPDVSTPLSIGFFRKAVRVVLPDRNYTHDELKLIFRHEVIHIGRDDSGTKFFMVFCTAMCWFNPLMWMAMRRSADDLELSCDETVLLDADDQTRRQYADLLLRTAGDERGFTTCLSASASALRYRLQNIVNPRKRLVGGILSGVVFFTMIMTCGYIALAYNDGTGHEYIYNFGNYEEHPISSITRHDADGYRYYDCSDEKALFDYLSSLELYQMTGNYSHGEDNKVTIVYHSSDGAVGVTVRENTITVSPLHGEEPRSSTYYCSQNIDWLFIDSLLYREPVVEQLPYPPEMHLYFSEEVNPNGQLSQAYGILTQITPSDITEEGILATTGEVGGINGYEVDKVRFYFSHDLYTASYDVKVEGWDYSESYKVSSADFEDSNVMILAPYSAHYTVFVLLTDGDVVYDMEFQFDVELP